MRLNPASPSGLLLLSLGLAFGCSSEGGGSGGTGGSGATTSGAVACETDDDCRERILAQAGPLDEVLPPVALSSGECLARGQENHFRETVCSCTFAVGDFSYETTLGHRETCDDWGRDSTCIAHPDDFLGCDLDAADSCAGPCQGLETAYNLDRSTTRDIDVRHASCQAQGGACVTVIRIDDRCFEGELVPGGAVYDCSLSDDEILGLADQSPHRARW